MFAGIFSCTPSFSPEINKVYLILSYLILTFYQFLPLRSYFVSKRPENFVRIAKFPYAAFGPLFAIHCPLFFTRNDDL